MSKHLHISDDLKLPIDAATQTFAFIARKGAGKTYAAGKLVEELLTHDVQVVILDTVGNWFGLRLGADGRSKGFDIPVLGGLRGDIPLEATGGGLIAEIVTDSGRSMVIDVSQFSLSDRKRFATSFGERLWQRKKGEARPSPLHLVIEESQLIVPQFTGRGGDEARMVGIYEEIIRLGRNYGIGVSMISQRPQSVNKEVLNQTECLFVGQVNGAQEREALRKWITHQGMDVSLVNELPTLPIGTFYVWSPQWLQILQKIRIGKKTTLDASSTPRVGESKERREPKPLDLDDLKQKMTATIERAKADDPKHLRAELAKARAELTKAQAKPAQPAAGKVKTVEKFVLRDGQLERADKLIGRIADLYTRLDEQKKELKAAADVIAGAIQKTKCAKPGEFIPNRIPANYSKPTAAARPRVTTRSPAPEHASNGDATTYAARDELPGPMRKIIDAYAFWHHIGVERPTRENIAPLAGYSNIRSSGFRNPLYSCQTAGLVEDDALTDHGRAMAAWPENITSLERYHDQLKSVMDGPTAKIFEALREAGASSTREELATATGYSNPRSSGFRNPLYRLSSMGVVSFKGEAVNPTELMYPPALVG